MHSATTHKLKISASLSQLVGGKMDFAVGDRAFEHQACAGGLLVVELEASID